jgi:methylenetetrahydrofolate dehydrogenase (NADP+)/methenyltetrahydrofolate cyclohydrolase
MRQLNGSELAGYIKERQAKQVRALRQSWKVIPKLAIIQTTDDPVIDIYVGLKKQYGQDVLVDVESHKVFQAEVTGLINKLNTDETVHGIIVQLPIEDPTQTDEIVNTIDPAKDVDGLGKDADYISATATSIDWLLNGYGVDLVGKDIAIVGTGRLVGAPLAKLWLESDYKVSTFDDDSKNMAEDLPNFGVIVCAAGVPGLVTSSMVKDNAVVVDAGTTAS